MFDTQFTGAELAMIFGGAMFIVTALLTVRRIGARRGPTRTSR